MSAIYDSFGRASGSARSSLTSTAGIARLRAGEVAPASLLAYGNGRSYGDSCLNLTGDVVDMRDLNHIRSFDRETGILDVDAGALLSDVIAHAAPFGHFPAVVPGTQFVTIGGAIANDVHGKNHHRRGTFGAHVISLTLLGSDGVSRICSASENADLFAATIGGMGLTGLILSAQIKLMPASSLAIVEDVTPFANLGEYFAVAEKADADNEYAVAWVDQLATGAGAGRGLLLTGNHAGPSDVGKPVISKRRLGVPFTPPITVLNRPFLTLFNSAYRWAKSRRAGQSSVTGHGSFFFPLDGVADWNRLYGPRGLFQHQSVIPAEHAVTAIPEMLAATREAGQGSFLTVLKRFGAAKSPGLLSFPRPGYTLTLDFPNRGERTLALLDQLDRITVSAGGAVNPYKDARMSAATFAASFPRWEELEARRDPAFMSAFWQRTAAKLGRQDYYTAQAAE